MSQFEIKMKVQKVAFSQQNGTTTIAKIDFQFYKQKVYDITLAMNRQFEFRRSFFIIQKRTLLAFDISSEYYE